MIMRAILIFSILAVGSMHYADSSSFSAVNVPKEASQTKKLPGSDIVTTFETNTNEGWQPRIGNEIVRVTAADKHTGSYSLLTSGRQAEYDGCKINVKDSMTTGSQYRISVWVKLASGTSSTIKVSLQRSFGGSTTYHHVVSKTVGTQSWARLTTVYDHKLSHDDLWLYVESAAGTDSFFIDDFDLEYLPPLRIEADIPSLKDHLAHDFRIGAAVWQGDIVGPHGELLSKHFNSITAEDAMKWGPIHPTESSYNFGPADALVAFARANGMKVRGHALVWHEQVPDWLFRDPSGNMMTATAANKALLLQRLDTHIRDVVTHFGDDVYAWDVVNEVIDENRPDGFRRNMWYQICGPEYIDRAFMAARAASPNAKLFINDYLTTKPQKRAFLIQLIRDLRGRGIPVDGIGHQMHSDIVSPTAEEVIETIEAFSTIPGLDNHITELDMSIYQSDTHTYEVIPDAVLLKQGYRYRDLFNAFRQLQGKISSVTFWGKADDHTWLSYYPITRLDAPLLFDDRLQAKPAYWGIVDPKKLTINIGGRIVTANGTGIRGAVVSLTHSNGERLNVVTGPMGYYQISQVAAFQNYTIVVSAKRYRFLARTVNPSGNLTDLDFVGLE
jgi:endo-1,4-beta-xylanase